MCSSKLLQAAGHEPREPERNPFRFEPAAPRTATGPVAARGARPARRRPAVRRQVPQGPPPPPPIPLRFIGLVERADAGGPRRHPERRPRQRLLREGRRYHRRPVSRAQIEPGRRSKLAYIDGRGRQTIRLSGQ